MIQESRRPSPSVLLIHFHSTQNAGDAFLLQAALSLLKEAFPEATFLLAANHPAEPKLKDLLVQVVPSTSALLFSMSRARPATAATFIRLAHAGLITRLAAHLTRNNSGPWLAPRRWAPLLHAYRRADLVVSVPGTIFFTMGRIGLPFLASALAVEIAHRMGKPFYVMPQSLGPVRRRWERRLLRSMYSRARLVMARDPISFQLARKVGLPPERLIQAADPALTCPLSMAPHATQMGSSPRALLGVNAIPRMVKSLPGRTMERYYSILALVLDEMIRTHGMRIVFLPQVTGPAAWEDDRVANRLVASRMRAPREHLTLIEEDLSLPNLLERYNQLDLFVASRLHAGLFAIRQGVPTVFIAYHPKSRGVLEMLDLAEWVVGLDELEADALAEQLLALSSQAARLRPLLAERIKRLKEHALHPGRLIAEDYERFRTPS